MNYSYRAGLDVLAGRSERIKKNNLFYRLQIHEHFALYNGCEDHDKRHVAQMIVHAVQSRGGRFLDSQGNVMSDRKALKKTMKALKDLRKTHGRKAPESLPPRLAKMTLSLQEKAAAAAATKLVELQHQWHLPEAWTGDPSLPGAPMITPKCVTPFSITMGYRDQGLQEPHHQWITTTNTMVSRSINSTDVSTSPSEESMLEEDYENDPDLYEPLPLDFKQEDSSCPSHFLGDAAEAAVASLTFV